MRTRGSLKPLSGRESALKSDFLAPTEDESVNLKYLFFVVLVFVYSKGVVVRIKMPLEVARITCMVSRGWGLGRKFYCAFKSL